MRMQLRVLISLLVPLSAFGQCDFSGKSYSEALKAGEFKPLCRFSFTNHGSGIMAGIEIDTDSDKVDTAAALRIQNSGQSDALYIGLAGKRSGPSIPTGTGIDINRGAGDHENSSQMRGIGINIWDWSEQDQGLDGPRGIFIQKVHNLNTAHRLIHLRTNQSAITIETPEGPGYDGSKSLFDVTTGRVQKAAIFADGSFRWGAGSTIKSSSNVLQYVGSIRGKQTLSVPNGQHCEAEATNIDGAAPHWLTIDKGVVTVHQASDAAIFDIFCTVR